MTQFLPPNLLALFAARDPIPFLPPPNKLPHEKKQKGYHGVGAFLDGFEQPWETPAPTRVERREERAERRRRERAEQVAYKLEQEIALWDPAANPLATADPFKSLFVARINYDTSESKLRREFEGYGPIKKIIVIHNTVDGKPRGYAFIEYEHERDMHSAYKHADGKKIDGKRVLVDVERARTVKGWLPRRLGGGLGGTRRGGADVNIKHSGREDNERERERYRLEREREERPDTRRDRDRDRGGSADRRRVRSRSRRRSRSRERRRARRSPQPVEDDRKERRRKRSRSGEKDRSGLDKERSRRDKDRDRGSERDRKRARRERKEPKVKSEDAGAMLAVKIKEEPIDDYPDYGAYGGSGYEETRVKEERQDEDEKKFRPDDANGHRAGDEYEDY